MWVCKQNIEHRCIVVGVVYISHSIEFAHDHVHFIYDQHVSFETVYSAKRNGYMFITVSDNFFSELLLAGFGLWKDEEEKRLFYFRCETREILMRWETISSLSGSSFIVSCGDCCGVLVLMAAK